MLLALSTVAAISIPVTAESSTFHHPPTIPVFHGSGYTTIQDRGNLTFTSCPLEATTQSLKAVSTWGISLVIPGLIMNGKPESQSITQSFLVSSDGTFSASDDQGNKFALGPVRGLPSGFAQTSLLANSTVADQTFLVMRGNNVLANLTVVYSINKQNCENAGIKMVIHGLVFWAAGTGVISIPFKSTPLPESSKANGTNRPASMRAIFGNAGGVSIGFDWSDSKPLNPVFDKATNSLTYAVGSSFTIDPVTVGTSNSYVAMRTDSDGQICYSQGRTWLFWFDGSNFAYSSSSDGVNWATKQTVPTQGVKSGGNIGYICNHQFAGQLSYVTTSSTSVVLGQGTMSATGSIQWGAESTFTPTHQVYNFGISWSFDTSGNQWVIVPTRDSSNVFHSEIWQLHIAWGEILDTQWSSGYIDFKMLQLSYGRLAVFGANDGNTGAGLLSMNFYDGTTWGTWVKTSTYQGFFMKGNCVATRDDASNCFIPNQAFNSDGPANYYNIPYGSTSWPTAVSLGTASEGGIATDGGSLLFVSFKDSNTNTVSYSASTNIGANWAPLTTLSTSESSPGLYAESMTTGDTLNLAGTPQVAAAWIQGTGAPFNIRIWTGSPFKSVASVNFDEQLGETFTQNSVSLSYFIGAITTTDSGGYGPAYLLNGLTDSGYWYQVGITLDWPYCISPGYTPSWSFVYEVFDPNGNSVFPASGCVGIVSFNGAVSEGDVFVLSLSISGGNVVMTAKDVGYGQPGANVIASQSASYSSHAATVFVGNPGAPANPRGLFTGFMTERYTVNQFLSDVVRAPYFNFATPITSAWLWGTEINVNTLVQQCNPPLNPANPNSFTTNPTTLQSFAVCGTTVQGDDYLFMTGKSTNLVTYHSLTCILTGSPPICPTAYTLAAGSDVKIETDLRLDTTPSSVQFFVNGGGGSVKSWDIAATGWTYINDYGPISTRGTYSIYSVTTYSDGSRVTSNTVTLTIS